MWYSYAMLTCLSPIKRPYHCSHPSRSSNWWISTNTARSGGICILNSYAVSVNMKCVISCEHNMRRLSLFPHIIQDQQQTMPSTAYECESGQSNQRQEDKGDKLHWADYDFPLILWMPRHQG